MKKIFMKLKEFFTYLKPDERISIVDNFGLIVEPVEYQKMSYVDVREVLDAEVMQVGFDHEDNSLTITIDYDLDEEEPNF